MIKPVTGGLYTDANANTNNTQWREHDCIGSLPNEPKTTKIHDFRGN